MSDDVDVIDTPEYRAAVQDGLEMAARFMERRANEIAGESLMNISRTMARIYQDEAKSIRKLQVKP